MRSLGLSRLGWLVVMLALSLLAGCGGHKRLTRENFDRIKEGMSLAEVEAILGRGEPEGGVGLAEGSSVAGAAGIGGDLGSISRPASREKWVRWGDDKKWIRIGFVGDQVAKGMIQQQGL